MVGAGCGRRSRRAVVPTRVSEDAGGAAACAAEQARRRELVDDYQAKFNNPYVAAARGLIDDVIDPADTRRILIRSLEVSMSKRERHAPRKHGISPM